ncbi:MAG TPA: hypothetical protein H9837_09625 [Candidatus Brachybacterium merdigallinarum]|nr:hypothetical protein [Candidatus Brachybacterium merdigallinarum]
MAYRFNPPPNWQIEDPDWTPPPGWQPDPAWGPAPDGWNFWIPADEAPQDQAPDDDATRVVSTGEQTGAPAADDDDDATRVASTGEQAGAPAADEDATREVSSGEYPVEAAPVDDATRVVSTGKQAGAPAAEDDASHVAGTGDQAPAAPRSYEQAADAYGPAETQAPAAAAPAAEETAEPVGAAEAVEPESSAETAEYTGPDLDADLQQQTPYEQAPYEEAPQAPYEQAAPYEAQEPADDPSAAPAAAVGAQELFSQDQQPVGHEPGYGQASPSQGYGQASPAPGYGQPSAGEPQFGDSSGWTATTDAQDAPKKGVVQRFWWLGCLGLLLVALLVAAVIGGVVLVTRGGDEPTGDGETTATSPEPSDEPTEDPTEEPSEEPTDDDETVTPTALPVIDEAAAVTQDVVGPDGVGSMAIQMAWVPGEDMPSTYGGTIEPAEHGEYLVVTAQITVTEGTMTMGPYDFEVVTPYGGAVDYSSETYGLEVSGLDFDAPNEFSAGETYTIQLLFDFQRAGGNVLNYETWTDTYSWDVPT